MADSLQKKIREVEEQHAEQIVTGNIERHDQSSRNQAFMFLGGALAIDRLKEHLHSQVIAAMMTVEDQKLYLEYGFPNFAAFLDQCELSPISKSQFYKLRELYLKEGPAQYDLFTEWKIPLSTRKLLSGGEVAIEIDGDEVVIGGEERVNIAESRTIKAIIEKLVKEKINLADDLQKQETKIEKQHEQIKKGVAENDELRRNIDALSELSPFKRALGNAVMAMVNLAAEAKALPEKERTARAEGDMQQLTLQWFQLRDAYGLKIGLSDDKLERDARLAGMKSVEEMTDEEKKETFLDRAMATIDQEDGFDDLD